MPLPICCFLPWGKIFFFASIISLIDRTIEDMPLTPVPSAEIPASLRTSGNIPPMRGNGIRRGNWIFPLFLRRISRKTAANAILACSSTSALRFFPAVDFLPLSPVDQMTIWAASSSYSMSFFFFKFSLLLPMSYLSSIFSFSSHPTTISDLVPTFFLLSLLRP